MKDLEITEKQYKNMCEIVKAKYNRALQMGLKDHKKTVLMSEILLGIFIGFVGVIIYLTIVEQFVLAIALGIVIALASILVVILLKKDFIDYELFKNSIKDAYKNEIDHIKFIYELYHHEDESVQ